MDTLVIFEQTKEQLVQWCKKHNLPSYRAGQILEWLWKKGVFDFSHMSNLGKKLQVLLAESFVVQPLMLQQVQISQNHETSKYLWKLADGALIESVLIRAPGRKTVCLSSQVGCPARCAFCASGKKGFIRNLSISEIVCQLLFIHFDLLEKEGSGVDHVVYMGMGEPLENFDNVMGSIELLTLSEYFGMSQRRITLSTVGVIEGLKRLAQNERLRINLALSLHAPTQEIRKKIIPYARKYDLQDILAAVDAYQRVSGRDVTFEYTLIEGINASVQEARALAQLLSGRQCTVNVIPYNPVPGQNLQKPSKDSVDAFYKELLSLKINATCRYTKGDDIAAACGQLALQE